MASYAIPLVDYVYKGYEQAPYTVTANFNVMKTKYTIRSIVCEASCHPVTWLLGNLVIR